MPARKKATNAVHVTEKELQKAITETAERLGWKWHHETYSLGTKPGWPDLTLVHPRHGVVWLELKASNGTPTPAQIGWIERLQEAGQRAYIVFPRHQDLVMALLAGEDVTIEDPQLPLWEEGSQSRSSMYS